MACGVAYDMRRLVWEICLAFGLAFGVACDV